MTKRPMHDPHDGSARPGARRWSPRRTLLVVCGFLALALGMVGVFLPILPTTPFVLLSAYCFARSSPRFYQMLLRNRQFGPIIRDWQHHRCIARRTKMYAVGLTGLAFVFSIGFVVEHPYVRLGLGTVGAVLLWFQLSIPTCDDRP